jgi:hypothetical protein
VVSYEPPLLYLPRKKSSVPIRYEAGGATDSVWTLRRREKSYTAGKCEDVKWTELASVSFFSEDGYKPVDVI